VGHLTPARGRRNQERQAVFQCATNIGVSPTGTILVFHLAQNHGGWNSDDLMNNNLGPVSPFRPRRNPAARRRWIQFPKRVRELFAGKAGEPPHGRAQNRRDFQAFGRTTVPEFKETETIKNRSVAETMAGGFDYLHAGGAGGIPREKPRFLKRGDWLKTDEAGHCRRAPLSSTRSPGRERGTPVRRESVSTDKETRGAGAPALRRASPSPGG